MLNTVINCLAVMCFVSVVFCIVAVSRAKKAERPSFVLPPEESMRFEDGEEERRQARMGAVLFIAVVLVMFIVTGGSFLLCRLFSII